MESELDELLQNLSDYDDDQLNVKPAPDVWSPLEVLYHMYLSEKLSLQYVNKKLSFDPHLRKTNLITRIRSSALSLFVKSPFKFSAPVKTRGDTKPSDLRLADLQLQWDEHRENLRQFLQTVDEKWLDREVFRHPIAGRISISQMMHFFRMHFARHRKQLMDRLPS